MNEIEVNGRITMLEAQRNAALNQSVIDAGAFATLRARIQELEAENASLTEKLAALEQPSPTPEPI